MKLRLLIRCCCLSACLFDQKVVWLFGSFPVNYCSETGVVMTPSVLQRAPAACSLSSIGCSTRPGQRKGTIDLSSGCLRTWLPWASATRGTFPAFWRSVPFIYSASPSSVPLVPDAHWVDIIASGRCIFRSQAPSCGCSVTWNPDPVKKT